VEGEGGGGAHGKGSIIDDKRSSILYTMLRVKSVVVELACKHPH
jgi:hypothetical protein